MGLLLRFTLVAKSCSFYISYSWYYCADNAFTVTQIHDPSRELSGGLLEGFERHLDYLSQLIETDASEPEQKTACLQALECLRMSFATMENSERPLGCGSIYMWPLTVDGSFIGLLRKQHGIALVSLVFYCAQLHAFSDYAAPP